MALLRYARKSVYGPCTSADMLFAHSIAWIAASIMDDGTAVQLKSTIVELDPGDAAHRSLGLYAKMAGRVHGNPDVRQHMREIATFTAID